MTITRLTTTSALTRAWRNLTHGAQLRRHSVWLMLLDHAHRPVQPVIELEDAEHPPPPGSVALLVDFLRELTEQTPSCRLAVLRSRPGRGGPTSTDRAWASALREAAAVAGLPCLAVHLANEEHLVAFPTPWCPAPDGRRGA